VEDGAEVRGGSGCPSWTRAEFQNVDEDEVNARSMHDGRSPAMELDVGDRLVA
jgi:hypothetical protein